MLTHLGPEAFMLAQVYLDQGQQLLRFKFNLFDTSNFSSDQAL